MTERRRVAISHVVGGVLAAAAVGWVVWEIWRHGGDALADVDRGRLIPAILGAAVIYSLLSWLIAGAWWWLTGVYGRRRPLAATAAVWTRTQIAKYLPGNLFHYVGRQALGRRIGLGHESLVAAHLLEMVSLFAAAAVLGLGGVVLSRSSASATVSLPLLGALVVAGVCAWPLIDAALRRLPFTAARMTALPRLSLGRTLRLLLPVVVLHVVFLAGTGLLLLVLLHASGLTAPATTSFVWIYALAWVAGTLTPGSPGGVGVREAVLTLGLGDHLGEGHAAALAVGLRLVTLIGDVLTFGAGSLVPLSGDHATEVGP